jgi:hypothetical protein
MKKDPVLRKKSEIVYNFLNKLLVFVVDGGKIYGSILF